MSRVHAHVKCVRHRKRVKAVTGKLVHTTSYDTCDSVQFTVEMTELANRERATAYLAQNVSGPRYGEPVSEDSGALYPQEALDAAAAELARRTHGGPADPEDILLASNVLGAAFSALRAAGA